MKKIFLILAVSAFIFACNNSPKEEEQENVNRENADSLKEVANQRFVDSLENADESKSSDTSHQGHHHDGGDHSGHNH